MMEPTRDNKKKIRLDEIKKESVHRIPEDFFDKLPTFIQSEIATRNHAPAGWKTIFSTQVSVHIALGTVIALMVCFYIFNKGSDPKNISSRKTDGFRTKNTEPFHPSPATKVIASAPPAKNSEVNKKRDRAIQEKRDTGALPIQGMALKYESAEEILSEIDKNDIAEYLENTNTEEYLQDEIEEKL